MIEQGGTHTDESSVANGAGMHCGIVTYGDIIANDGGTSGVGDMNARTILHVGAVADGDGSHISTYHSIKPDGTFITHSDFANDGGILTEITVTSPFRG